MNGFDEAYGAGATEKFRAAAVVEPFDQVELAETHPGILRFRMSGPDAFGLVVVTFTGDGHIEWSQMEVRPSGAGIMGRLATAWGPVLAELGIESMRIAGMHPAFEQIGFAKDGTSAVATLVEYSEWRRGEITKPGWRE